MRKAIEAGLVCPPPRDALEYLAKQVPSCTGPKVDILDNVLFVDDAIWRFRTAGETRRFAEMMESYFRNFDPAYRIKALEPSTVLQPAVGFH